MSTILWALTGLGAVIVMAAGFALLGAWAAADYADQERHR